MDFPGGDRHGVFVGGVAAPETLYECGGRNPSPDHMLLSLLLLDFESKSRAEYSLRVNQYKGHELAAKVSKLFAPRWDNVAGLSSKCDEIALLTAGNAKKEIPNRAQKDAIIFPGHVIGTVSP